MLEGVISRDEVDRLVADFESVMTRAPTHQGAELDAQGRPSIDQEFEAPPDAPEQVVLQISGSLQMMDANLELYGHPKLLRVAEAINGGDFVPFTDAVWVKPAHYGAAVSWHQDGLTHWENPDLDAGTHGFNFMAQLYPTNPMYALWIIPESHDKGKADINQSVSRAACDLRLRLPPTRLG